MAPTPAEIRFERFIWRPDPGMPARGLAALVVSFLLFGPYLANVSRDYTRVCYYWRTGDTVLLIFLVLFVAGFFWALTEAVRRTGSSVLIRLARSAFLLGLGIGVWANIAFLIPKLNLPEWILSPRSRSVTFVVLAAMVAAASLDRKARPVAWCRSLCLVAAPAVALTFLTLLYRPNYPERMDPIPPIARPCAVTGDASQALSGGIYVLLFDEWSYERTFDEGSVSDRYPHLAEFAGMATTYGDARSPAGYTEASVPGILFQTNDPVVVDRGRFGFSHQGEFVSARRMTSMFSRLKPLGMHSAMLGFALPYQCWLADTVEVCRSYCYYPRSEHIGSRLGLHLLNAWRYVPDPWSRRGYKQVETPVVHALLSDIIDGTRRDAETVIREWPANTFLFVHMHLPHMPAIINADLSVRSLPETVWQDDNLDAYESNLQAMDAMAGQLIAALRSAGKFDNSLVIATSDHNWRHDPLRQSGQCSAPITHVPLLVKAPGQTSPASVTTPFETKDLAALIESLMSPSGDAVAVIAENPSP